MCRNDPPAKLPPRFCSLTTEPFGTQQYTARIKDRPENVRNPAQTLWGQIIFCSFPPISNSICTKNSPVLLQSAVVVPHIYSSMELCFARYHTSGSRFPCGANASWPNLCTPKLSGSGKSSLIYTWWRALSGSVTGKEEFFAENVHNVSRSGARGGEHKHRKPNAERRGGGGGIAFRTREKSSLARNYHAS